MAGRCGRGWRADPMRTIRWLAIPILAAACADAPIDRSFAASQAESVAASSAGSPAPPVAAVVAALSSVPAEGLWPNFSPMAIPVAIYDGERTLLIGHPAPPEEFGPAAAPSAPASVVTIPHAAAAAVSTFDKRNPFSATVTDNLPLTGRGSSKETRHIELSLEGAGLSFQPGDALGVMPRNDPALVEALLAALETSPEAAVSAIIVLWDRNSSYADAITPSIGPPSIHSSTIPTSGTWRGTRSPQTGIIRCMSGTMSGSATG